MVLPGLPLRRWHRHPAEPRCKLRYIHSKYHVLQPLPHVCGPYVPLLLERGLPYKYEAGQIHGLDSRENPGTSYSFDCLALDVGISDEYKATHNLASPDVAIASQELFNAHSRQEDRIVSTDEMSEFNGDLMTLKKSIIANVVTQGADIEAEFARFESEGGADWSKQIVDSLNALK